MPVSASEIRELLRLIRGVEAVEVRVAPDGSIDSVEVRIAESRSTARVIRDIESALMSGLGLRIDHKAIHIANGAGNGSAGGYVTEPMFPVPGDEDPEYPTPEGDRIRLVIGKLAKDGKWIKRIDYAQKVFAFALPYLPDGGILMSRLDALWQWIQDE